MATCDFLSVQAHDNIVLARPEKDRLLDAAAIAVLSADLDKLVDRYPKISLDLDLGAVQSLSSAMLGKLVALHKAVKAAKGRMALAGVKPSIMPLFTVTKLDRLFEFYPEAQEVILLYRRKPV